MKCRVWRYPEWGRHVPIVKRCFHCWGTNKVKSDIWTCWNPSQGWTIRNTHIAYTMDRYCDIILIVIYHLLAGLYIVFYGRIILLIIYEFLYLISLIEPVPETTVTFQILGLNDYLLILSLLVIIIVALYITWVTALRTNQVANVQWIF